MPILKTVAELAGLVSGELHGEGGHVITGAATLADAGPADISFLGNPKYAGQAADSRAGCLFLPIKNKDLKVACPRRIYVEDPQYAFSQVLWLLSALPPKTPVLDSKAQIHYQAKMGPNVSVGPFAVVERGALIGEGTTIAAQCFIGDNAKIGRHCLIHPRVVIRENCVLGDRVIIQPGAVIGGDGYGFSTDKKTGKHRKIPQIGNVVIGDDVEIGANVTVDRATVGSTVIGAGTKIDNLVMLAHNVKTGKDCLIVSQVGVSGSTTLGDRVILAGQAGLIGHLKIGDGAIIMAQTGVMNDIAAGDIHFGTPSRPTREAMKLQALTGRLPDLFAGVKEIKKRLGLDSKPRTQEATHGNADHD